MIKRSYDIFLKLKSVPIQMFLDMPSLLTSRLLFCLMNFFSSLAIMNEIISFLQELFKKNEV